MVFFVCEGCNETLKKNQVDKHAMKCRFCEAVTCVDCSVTFYGNDYAAHTTCVSEAEKYEKSLYKEKKAKANPQDAWTDLLAACAQSAPPQLKSYLERISSLGNAPRAKKKFVNFCKNSLNLHNDKILDQIWEYVESVKQQDCASNPQSTSVEGNENIQKLQIKMSVKVGDVGTEINASMSEKKRKLQNDGNPCADIILSTSVLSEEKQKQKKKKSENSDSDKPKDGYQDAIAEVVVESDSQKTKKNKRDKKKKRADT